MELKSSNAGNGIEKWEDLDTFLRPMLMYSRCCTSEKKIKKRGLGGGWVEKWEELSHQ